MPHMCKELTKLNKKLAKAEADYYLNRARFLRKVLKQCNGDILKVSKRVGIHYKTALDWCERIKI